MYNCNQRGKKCSDYVSDLGMGSISLIILAKKETKKAKLLLHKNIKILYIKIKYKIKGK